MNGELGSDRVDGGCSWAATTRVFSRQRIHLYAKIVDHGRSYNLTDYNLTDARVEERTLETGFARKDEDEPMTPIDDDTADLTFATHEWLRLLATYTCVHITIHVLSKLKRYLRPEHVASHYPDPVTTTRGGSGSPNGTAARTIGTYDALKGQCVPKSPPHMRRSQSFGLNPEDLAENVLSMGVGAAHWRGDDDGNDDDDVEDVEDVGDVGDMDGDARATTRRQLRALYRTRDFKAWMVRNKLDSERLQRIYQRLHLYKMLKEIHPASFWALCSPESLKGVDAVEVTALAAAGEYVASRAMDLSVAYLAYLAYTLHNDCLVPAALSYALVVRHWAQGRSSGAWMFRAWYTRVEDGGDEGDEEGEDADEDARAGIAARLDDVGLVRAAAANVLEDVFVVGSLGVGALLSLAGILRSVRRQSTGERAAGVASQRCVPVDRRKPQ